MQNPLLDVQNLHVSFDGQPLLRDVSFSIYPQETLALVGESGSGKTITAMAIMNLFRSPLTSITSGKIFFENQDLVQLPPSGIRAIRGHEIAFIPQSPLSSLNPTLTIGTQLTEGMSKALYPNHKERLSAAVEILRQVGFSDCQKRLNAYPHELSGGMRQRLLIAMALVNRPKLVIADEPTTALDVTIQAQVLDLLMQLQDDFGMSLLFITHDMGVVARLADRVAVMYAGKIVELASTQTLFSTPQHPYSQALLACLPRLDARALEPIQGSPPQIGQYLHCCAFAARCPFAMRVCAQQIPPLVEYEKEHLVSCWKMECRQCLKS